MENEKWMYQIGKSDIWTSSERFETKEEAIEAGREEAIAENKFCSEKNQYEKFYVGQIEKCNVLYGVDVDSILGNIVENVCDEAGEAAEDYLRDVTREHMTELEEKLNDVLFAWMDEHRYKPNFFKIVNEETIVL